MGFDPKYYLSAGLRRLPVFLTILFAITVLFSWIALSLPPTYEATARLLVAGPEIIVENGVVRNENPGEQLEVMEQQLMTRQNLIEIANTHGVFAEIEEMSPDDVVEYMRELTGIQRTAGRERATLMSISFVADRPQVVARVVNDYVTRIQAQSKGDKVREAEKQRDFYAKQVDSLGADLDRVSERIAKFKTANADSLPDSLDFRMTRQSSQQELVSQWRRDKSALEGQRDRLVEIIKTGDGSLPELVGRTLTPDEQRLDRLRSELSELLAILSPINPRVKVLEAQIVGLEEKIAGAPVQETESQPALPADPARRLLEAQLSDLDARIVSLEDQILSAEEELVTLTETIERTPANAITLQAMEREFSNIQDRYNSDVAQLARSETDVQVEAQASGGRIEVIEQPVVPSEPVSPNRPVIAGAGVFIGFLIGTAVVVVLEMLNRAIRRPLDLTRGLGISPLVTIPYIRTRREIFMTRLKAVAIPVVVTGVAAACLFAVDQFVMPLDLVLDKISDRLAL